MAFSIDKTTVMKKKSVAEELQVGEGYEFGVIPRSFSRVMEIFCILIVVVITSIHACVKNLKLCSEKVNFLCHNLKNKIIFKNRCGMLSNTFQHTKIYYFIFFCSMNMMSSINIFPDIEPIFNTVLKVL